MISIRTASPHETNELLEFWSTAAVGGGRPTDTAGAVQALLARDPEALFLALDDERIVGSLIAGWDGWRCHLYRLAVAPTHRRQGLGRLLIEAAEDRFRSLGGVRADAMVLDENAIGCATWEAAGYVRETDCSRWVHAL